MSSSKRGCFSKLKIITLFAFLILGIVFSIIALMNLRLPDESFILDRLSIDEQHRITEIIHLKNNLGNEIWPGWGDYKTPILVYNEAYAFLTGIENPAPGWARVPYTKPEGKEWEQVSEIINYHRQPLPENGKTPQTFIVKIGDDFVASMTTKDWTRISLVKMIKEDLPGFLEPIMPYSLFINRFNSDWHVAGILHESFHAFQASHSYERVKSAEAVNALHDSYPWENIDFREAWLKERQLLAKALQTKQPEQTKEIVREWLSMRGERQNRLSTKLINYENEREWLEGLAKYAELKSWQLASDQKIYSSLPEMEADEDFNHYQDAERHRKQELIQLQSDLQFSETMFYYSGWAQAELLDRLYPDWKSRAFEPGTYLDDLLAETCVPLSYPLL